MLSTKRRPSVFCDSLPERSQAPVSPAVVISAWFRLLRHRCSSPLWRCAACSEVCLSHAPHPTQMHRPHAARAYKGARVYLQVAARSVCQRCICRHHSNSEAQCSHRSLLSSYQLLKVQFEAMASSRNGFKIGLERTCKRCHKRRCRCRVRPDQLLKQRHRLGAQVRGRELRGGRLRY
jgi:hypothetical protein